MPWAKICDTCQVVAHGKDMVGWVTLERDALTTAGSTIFTLCSLACTARKVRELQHDQPPTARFLGETA